ncbi:MAG: HAD family hydrolase [Longibaculum sp.]
MKNIIFDIGNVLLDFQPEKYLKQYFNESVMGDLMTIIFSSDEWIDLDMGTIMIQDAIDTLTLKHPHYHDEITFVLNNWTHMMTPLNQNVEIAKELKDKGYSLYLLSNFHSEAILTMYKRYDFFKMFDGAVISADEHLVKPDDRIYQILIERYSLLPEESVFIDDLVTNTNAAQRLGITGIHLPYGNDLRKELENLNIL